jgi:formylglycine-generating enzyme required for sulfatase activity
MMLRILGSFGIVLIIAVSLAQAERISIETVTVGNAGNRADASDVKAVSSVQSVGAASARQAEGYGRVAYSYSIGKYEVTNSQYAAFLNAVAAREDKYKLYNTLMADHALGGICQSFDPVNKTYTYEVKTGCEKLPVVFVNWYDAVRFCNWLSNGQLGEGTTESGVYKLTGLYCVDSLPDHSSLSVGQWFLPSEDEWYKAAYYNGEEDRYWDYATQSDTAPANPAPEADTGNSANYYASGFVNYAPNVWDPAENYLTEVGGYEHSGSYYQTFDQNGNVLEWNEAAIMASDGSMILRGIRGGGYCNCSAALMASYSGSCNPATEENRLPIGFRVARAIVPAPGSIVGMTSLGLMGLLLWKRRRAAT